MNAQEIRNYSEITEELYELAELVSANSVIPPELYGRYDVKRGLRDLDGSGVLAGLTSVSEVTARCEVDGKIVPCDGRLYYRGINVNDLTEACLREGRAGFEEAVYLLLFGQLPTAPQLKAFNKLLGSYRSLPPSFVRDVIMKAPSKDLMNAISRSVLTMYSYDDAPDDTSIPNVLRQCLQLISVFLKELGSLGIGIRRVYQKSFFCIFVNGNVNIGADKHADKLFDDHDSPPKMLFCFPKEV